jgi:hypothetical protein
MRCAFLTGTSSGDHTQQNTSRAHNTELIQTHYAATSATGQAKVTSGRHRLTSAAASALAPRANRAGREQMLYLVVLCAHHPA